MCCDVRVVKGKSLVKFEVLCVVTSELSMVSLW